MHSLGNIIRTISSNTILKSSYLGVPLEKAPGTFSQHNQRGRTFVPNRPRAMSAALISFTMRTCSINSPERSPERPALAPATERSWQGLPPHTRVTGGNSAPLSFVMSPTWTISGKCCFVTSMGNDSISLAHRGLIPLRIAANGKPPMPSKRLPMVSSCCGSAGKMISSAFRIRMPLSSVLLISPPPVPQFWWCLLPPAPYRRHS